MSESIQLTGSVVLVEETKEYGSNGFTKRVLVVEVQDGQYSQTIPVEAVKDKCAMFDGINQGDIVTVHINLRGSEWNGRYFLSANCWRIETEASAPSGESDRPVVGQVNDALGTETVDGGEFDNDPIPF